MNLFPWMSRPSFDHGVHPPESKDDTSHLPIRRLPFPPIMIVPLSQHTGAPAEPVVREGQEVVRGEPLATAAGFVSVPMHSPATGVVKKIALAPSPKGVPVLSVYLELYAGASQEVLYSAPQNIEEMSPREVVNAVQETGVVGLGGAAFPTHVKLAVPEGAKVDTVIANGCECEPYLTTDHRVMIECAREILEGIRIVRRALDAQEAFIGVEDNKLDAVASLEAALDGDDSIAVSTLRTKYPQGAEKMLIKALVGREVPSGGLPYQVGVAVFNVATLAQIGELLPQSRGLIERVVTITGPGVSKPGNYLMPLGTPLRFALEHAQLKDSAREVILGGPMMGGSVASLDLPVTKGITGVLVLDGERGPDPAVYPCIRCGACVEACPLHLNPQRLGSLARKQRYEEMEDDFHLKDCFECGSCSYVCPSHIPLVHLFRCAKVANRDRGKA